MDESYARLAVVTLLPVAAAAILYLLGRSPVGRKMNRKVFQLLCGLVFGGLAILGTEWGIPLNGAQINCRDGAVLTAGLMFGAPAGIIAGIIGGVERWVAVAWGVGTFTRVACSLSTLIAGFYAALLRKYMFEDKMPGFVISFAIGVVMEIFHLTMVFLTNMDTPNEAMAVVHSCTIPMVLTNSIAVMLSAVVIGLFSRNVSITHTRDIARISQTIQRWLLVTVGLAFAATSYFVYNLQTEIATTQSDTLLAQAIDEVAADIEDASDKQLLTLARAVAEELKATDDLKALAKAYQLSEINIVDQNGIITASTTEDYLNFDMSSGRQAAEFLCLLGDTEEFVQPYGRTTFNQVTLRKYAGVKFGDGFVQVGYNATRFQQSIDDEVLGITKNRHVGESGGILILDGRMQVASAPEWVAEDQLVYTVLALELPKEDVTFQMTLGDTLYDCRHRSAEGYEIISALPEAEALRMRNIALYVNTFMEILVFAILFGLIYLLIKRVVVNQIMSINLSLAKITGGNLDEVVNVRTNAEFASLSDDINTTVDTLKRYISEAAARIDQELKFAKSIQNSALPNVFPAFPKRKDFDIYAQMRPAKEVGGDFYDFYITNQDTLHFLVADVSGKGIPAAMFMMRAKTELKSLTEADIPLNEVFTRGNQALCEGNDAGMFVTAWQGSIDLTTGHVQFANAGHNPPLVRRGNGRFEYLRSRAGFVLAGMEGVRYKIQELQLEPGDMIYLYTDGVTEATNAANELYGEERLLSAINAHDFEDMQDLCNSIRDDVDAFVGEAPQFDDITMVALKFIGTPPPPSIHVDEAALEDIPQVTEFVEAELEKLDCPMKTVMQLSIAIDEIYSNIVRYGYSGKPGPVTVSVIARTEPHAVYLRFCDEGIPYNPLTKEDPDTTLSAEERSIGGLGIFMVKKTMDDVKYRYENGENILTICKKLD